MSADTSERAEVSAIAADDLGCQEGKIDFFGSLCLLVNNTTGPAMVALPFVYQQAGWLTPTLTLLFVMVSSSFASTMVCRALALVPGNSAYQRRFELTDLARHYLPRWAFYTTLVLFLLALASLVVASIVVATRTLDLFLIAVFKYTGALAIAPNPGWSSATEATPPPFDNVYGVSLGFVLVAAAVTPLGLLDLDGNIRVQKASFLVLAGLVVLWVIHLSATGLDTSLLPAVGSEQGNVLGTVVFNYIFVMTVPSWIHETRLDHHQRRSTRVTRVIWLSSAISTAMYLCCGVFGSLVLRMTSSLTLLDVLYNRAPNRAFEILARISVFAFPLAVVISSIPIYTIVLRLNIVQATKCKPATANWIVGVAPWVISIAFLPANGLLNILNWVGIVVAGVVAFIIPFVIYIIATKSAAAVPVALKTAQWPAAEKTSPTGPAKRRVTLHASSISHGSEPASESSVQMFGACTACGKFSYLNRWRVVEPTQWECPECKTLKTVEILSTNTNTGTEPSDRDELSDLSSNDGSIDESEMSDPATCSYTVQRGIAYGLLVAMTILLLLSFAAAIYAERPHAGHKCGALLAPASNVSFCNRHGWIANADIDLDFENATFTIAQPLTINGSLTFASLNTFVTLTSLHMHNTTAYIQVLGSASVGGVLWLHIADDAPRAGTYELATATNVNGSFSDLNVRTSRADCLISAVQVNTPTSLGVELSFAGSCWRKPAPKSAVIGATVFTAAVCVASAASVGVYWLVKRAVKVNDTPKL